MLGLHGQVHRLEEGFNRLKLAVGGALSIAAGTAILGVLGKVEKAGEKMIHAQTAFTAALPAQQRAAALAEVTATAWAEAGKNMNTSVASNIEMIQDLYGVVQDVGHAQHLLKTANQMKVVLDSLRDGEHAVGEAASNKSIASAIRAFELTGRTDEHTLEEMGKLFIRGNIALRGRVNGGNFLTAVQGAGDARYGWSDDFVSRGFMAMVNAGGTKVGNLLNMLSSNLYGGVGSSKEQAAEQIKYGLHKESDRVGKSGRSFAPGSVWEGALLRSNPLEWANKYLEKLRGMGVDTSDTKTVQDIVAKIARGNRSVKAALDELLLPSTNRQLNKEVGNIGSVGKDAYDILQSNDPKLLRQALHAQFENLMQSLGGPLVKPAMIALKSLTEVIRDLSQMAAANPDAVVAVGRGIAAIGAALVGAGAAAMIAALGPVGWLVGGVTGLIAAWSQLDPSGFKATLVALKNGIAQAYEAIKGFATDPATIAAATRFWQAARDGALQIYGYAKDFVTDPAMIATATAFWRTARDGAFEIYEAAKDFVTDPAMIATATAFWRTARDGALEIYEAAKGFVTDPAFFEPLKAFWRDTKAEAVGIYEALKSGFEDPKSSETVRGTLTTTMSELKWVLDWYRQLKEMITGGAPNVEGGKPFDLKSLGIDFSGKPFDLKSLGIDFNGDILGQLATKLRETISSLSTAVSDAATSLANEIKSWPARLGDAIAEMGANLVKAIGDTLRSLLPSWLGGATKKDASFEGGGLGGMIQRASFGGGGGAGDGFGGASGVANALGRGGFGGSGGGFGNGVVSGPTQRDLADADPAFVDYIRRSAEDRGIDPNAALRIANAEGLRGSNGSRLTPGDFRNGRATSWGPFQLHLGGRGSLGTEYMRATGHHPGDPRYWQEQIDFALNHAKKHGWAAWFGRRGAGLGVWDGVRNAITGAPDGLRIKSAEALGGGPIHPGLLGLAEQLQKGGGVNRFTAFNDRYHQGTGSKHAHGLATDVTGDAAKIMANARAIMAAAGLAEGKDFRMLNEYANPSRRATGGHVHFEFRNRAAADAYEAARAKAAKPRAPTAGPPPREPSVIQAHHTVNLDGRKVAQSVTRHQVAMSRFPTSVGQMDSYGTRRQPGTPLIDSA